MLFFSGVGGVGKSTLLAKFILQHVDTDGEERLRFAYLDFDRSTISASQPGTLLLEILRQLGWQLPIAQNDLEALCNRIRQEMEQTKQKAIDDIRSRFPRSYAELAVEEDALDSGDQELPPELIGPSLMSTYLYEAGRILSRTSGKVALMLLVLDTFEEAQALGDSAVVRIETFLEAAQEGIQGLRVVLSGRDEVADFFPGAERMLLSEFSDEASRIAFLEKRGLSRQSAKSVGRHSGGRPLTLQLAARLVKEEHLESVSAQM